MKINTEENEYQKAKKKVEEIRIGLAQHRQRPLPEHRQREMLFFDWHHPRPHADHLHPGRCLVEDRPKRNERFRRPVDWQVQGPGENKPLDRNGQALLAPTAQSHVA